MKFKIALAASVLALGAFNVAVANPTEHPKPEHCDDKGGHGPHADAPKPCEDGKPHRF